MMSPEQCRAARAWLDMTQAELAQAAVVALSTLKDFEGGRRTPVLHNLKAIQAVLKKAGIAFVEGDNASGITFSKPTEKAQ